MAYDLLIVGGRVAGASLALLMGRRGYRVLLVDRDEFPSDTLSTHYLPPAAGASNLRIMRSAVMPNTLAPIVVLATLGFPVAVLAAAALSFLGLGAQPPSPEWGAMIVSGRTFITTAPWLINYPGLAIFVTVLGFNLFGNAVRDALDPRLRQR